MYTLYGFPRFCKGIGRALIKIAGESPAIPCLLLVPQAVQIVIRRVSAIPNVLRIIVHFAQPCKCAVVLDNLNGPVSGKCFGCFSNLSSLVICQPFIRPYGDDDRFIRYDCLAFVNIIQFVDAPSDIP